MRRRSSDMSSSGTEPVSSPFRVNYMVMTYQQLRDIAKEKGVEADDDWTKTKLIEILEAYDAPDVEEEEELAERKYVHPGHPENLPRFGELPVPAIIEVIMNTHPRDLPGLCAGNKRIGKICNESIVKKRYVQKWGLIISPPRARSSGLRTSPKRRIPTPKAARKGKASPKKSPEKRSSKDRRIDLIEALHRAVQEDNPAFFEKWYPVVGFGKWVIRYRVFQWALNNEYEEILRELLKTQEVRGTYLGVVMESDALRLADARENLAMEILSDPSIDSNSGRAFVKACDHGSKKLIRAFLKHPRIKPSLYGNLAICHAAQRGFVDIVKDIAEHPSFKARDERQGGKRGSSESE